MDDLNILLKAKLDINNSIKNINNQVDEISKRLKDINISLNTDDFKSAFESIFKDIDNNLKKTKVYDSTETKNEISKTIKDFKSLKSEIDNLLNNGFKKGKTSTSLVDLGEGNKLKKIVEEYNDELNHSVQIIQNIDSKTGNLVSIEKVLTDNAKARVSEEEKLVNAMAKGRELSEIKVSKNDKKEELSQANAINKALEEQYKLEKDIAIWKEKQEINISKLASKDGINTSELNKLKESLNKISAESADARNEMKLFQNELARVNVEATNSSDSILKTAMSYFTLYDAFQLGKQAIRELYKEVLSLDKSLLEVQKVTDIVDLDGFIKEAYNGAEALKIAGTDFIDGIAEFSRQGKTIEEAFDLSTVSNQMVLVGDNINSVSEAASVLTSALSIFEKQGYTAKDILDQINQISNKTSSEFSDLSDIVRRSSATLGLSGASLEQLLALGTSLQKTLRNSEMVGTSLNAINQKLMGLNDEGEETVELVAKIGDDMKKLMGIDMMDEATGQMKSTFQILEEMANKWNDVDKNTQLATASLVGNIRHSKSVVALMENWDEVEKSLYESTQATNSSQNELQAYLDSTTGKVEGLKGAMQELYISTVSSDTIGNIAEIITNIIKLSTELGGLIPIVQTLVGLFITMKAQSTGKFLTDIAKTFVNIGVSAKTLIQVFGNLMLGTQSLSGAMKTLNISASTLAGGGIGLLITAIGSLVMYQNKVKAQQEEMRQETAKLAEEYASSSNELSKLKQEYVTIVETCKDDKEIKTQLKGIQEKLIANYAIEKDTIDLVNGSYEKQIELLDNVIDSKSKMALMFAEDNLEEAKKKQLLDGKGSYSFYSGMPNELSDADKETIKDIAKQINDEFKGAMNVSFDDGLFSLNRITISSSNLKAQEKLLELLRNAGLESDKLYDSFKSMYQENLNLSNGVNKELENRNNILAKDVENVARAKANITDYTKATAEQCDTFIKKSYEEIDAMDQDIETKKQLKSIMDGVARESFPQFFDGLSGVDNLLDSLQPKQSGFASSLENLNKQFDNASNKLATLDGIAKELKESNGLSADSFKKIASEFPELLGYMNDEASLADAIKSKMESLSEVQNDAYRQMLFNSEEYYEQNVLGNEQMVNSISTGIENLFRNLSNAYQGDLNNWKTLAQGKADIETQLINSLNKAWESHFGTLMTQFNKMPNTPIANPQFDEEGYKNQLATDNPLLTARQIEGQTKTAKAMFNQQTSDYKQFQKEVVKRNQELANLFGDVKFDAVDIKVGGKTAKPKKDKKSKAEYEKYYSQLIDEKISVILSENERLEDAIAFAQEKLANAELKGDTEQQENLKKQILEFTKQKKELSNKMANELREVGNDVRIQLGNMNIKGYENFNFSNLNELDVAKITQSFDKLAVGASDAVKANIEVQKSKFQELANVVMRIYGEEIPNLQKQWWSEDTNYNQQRIDKIHEIAELEKRAYDDKVKQIELEQMLMDDSSAEYQAKEEEKYQLLLGIKLKYEDKVRQLKEQGLNDEQEDVRKYKELYRDAEEQRLNMVIQFAEKRRQAEIKANQKATENLRDVQNSPKELLDMVMSMLRQETEDRKDELDKQLDDKKKSLEETHDVEKKAIEDRLELIRKEADERKKALQDEQDERGYNRGLEDKQKQVKDVQDKILALENDDSIQALKKRKELEAELAKYKQELEDYQYDHQMQIREDAIDKELESQTEKLDKELEALDDRYDKELDMLDKKHKQEIKKYEEMLSSQKKLREEALRLIEKGERELYDKLIVWNDEYGSGISEDISSAWDSAYLAMKTYGDGSNNVLETMVSMREEMERLVEEAENLAEATWRDYADEEDLKPGGGGSKPNSNSSSSSSKPSDKYDGLTDKSDKEEYRDKQLKKMVDLGDEMDRTPSADKDKIKQLKSQQESIAQTIGAYNQGGTWYIVIDKKKYRVRDAIGVRHTGVRTGFVGNRALSKEADMFANMLKNGEEWNILDTGEIVVNNKQMKGFINNVLPSIAMKNKQQQVVQPNININVASITKDSLPDFKKFVKKEVPQMLDNMLFKRGIK